MSTEVLNISTIKGYMKAHCTKSTLTLPICVELLLNNGQYDFLNFNKLRQFFLLSLRHNTKLNQLH